MIPVAEISRRLTQRVDAVAPMLLPGGRVVKNEYVCASIQGGQGDSLRVHLEGTHAGRWIDWANQSDKGDLLDLWRVTRNLSPGEALRQAKQYLGINDPVRREKPKTYAQAPKKPEVAPNPQGRVFKWFTEERKILPETLKIYRVSTQTEPFKAIVFPSISLSGEVINRSYRTLPAPGEKKETKQDKGCAPSLFGWHVLTEEALKSRTILLCEGQIDCMSWYQWGIPALSIPNGSGMTWLDFEFDNLTVFERIYLAFDMDPTGRKITADAIARIGPERCYIVELPHKDANECLQKGCTPDQAKTWIEQARAPKVTGLVTGNDIRDRVKLKFMVKPKPFTLAFFDKNWSEEWGFYFRPGEVTLWSGHSHAGKSTFLNYLMIGILAAHLSGMPRQSVFIGSFEVTPETTMHRMIVAYYAVCRHPLDPETATDSFMNEYGDNIVMADVVGFITREMLFEQMKFAFRRFGVMNFVVDSLMKIQGLEEDNPAQGDFINSLQEFAKSTGVHIHLVAHPRKGMQGSNGKPGAQDIKGSSLIYNGVDNIAILCRNAEKEEAKKEGELTPELRDDYDTEIRIEKQKDSGWTGAFFLKFNPRDYTYAPTQKRPKAKPQRQNGKFKGRDWIA